MKNWQARDGDGTVTLREKIMGDGNGTKEAPRQHAWGKSGNSGVTAPLQESARAACGSGGGAVKGRRREASTCSCVTVAPAAMVVEAAQPGGGGGNPGGGRFLGPFGD